MKRKHLWLAALLALPGCTTLPAQDVEFVRGCWVARTPPDGPVEAMLRLLPDGADGPTYQGVIHEFSGPPNDPQGRDTVELSFSRDGRWLDLANHAAAAPQTADTPPETRRFYVSTPPDTAGQLPASVHAAVFSESGSAAWIRVSGDNEHLTISLYSTGKPDQTLLAAARDGCD